MKKNRLLVLPLIVIGMLSCSIDYGEAEVAEEINENIPDYIIENFSYASVDNGELVFRIYAESAMSFSKRKETILNNAVFREYDPEGEVVSEGTAEKGVIFTDTDDAELTGSLIIYSAGNEAEISADYLYWDESDRTLKGSENGKVNLIMDSGTEIEGIGFTGDMRTKIFNFREDVNGIYHYDED